MMKKTLLALSVIVAASSANAAIELYNKDGLTVNVSGAAEVQLRDKFSKKDAELRIDDADFALAVNKDLGNGLTAISSTGFAYENGKDVENDELFVGLKSNNYGTFTVGRQVTIIDEVGIGQAYELGGSTVDFKAASGNEVIKYEFDNGTFYAGVAHDLERDGNETITDGRLGYKVAGFDFSAYGFYGNNLLPTTATTNKITAGKLPNGDGYIANAKTVTSTKTKVQGYQLQTTYTKGDLFVGASYGEVEVSATKNGVREMDILNIDTGTIGKLTTFKPSGFDKEDFTFYEVATTYTIDKHKFGLGYAAQEKATTSVDTVYTNYTHTFNDNVKAYGEVGYQDKAESEFGYVAGLEVKF